MSDNPEFSQQPAAAGDSNAAGEGFRRLMAATAKLETLLEETLSRYAALKAEHRKLAADHHALKAKTESVGAELDVTIASLKVLMAARSSISQDNGAGGETWVK